MEEVLEKPADLRPTGSPATHVQRLQRRVGSNNELHRHVDITHGKGRQAKKKQEAAEQAIDALVNCYAAMAMEDAEETNQELNQPKEEDRLAESTIENDSCDDEPSGFYHLEDGTESSYL